MAEHLGQQVGNYRLTRLLGQGGFAEVYLGEHVHLGSQAAVKLLHTQLAAGSELEKFRLEAQTLVTLQHPHIVRILDFGVEAGTPYLVMDYAPNGSLRQHLAASTPLPPATILPYLLQVASALQYAHEQQLIHRDVKPENMLLGRTHEVLLTDFGIATVAQSTSQQRTQGVAGTAAYMAPEQLQGKPRPTSDLYALGIVVYEWLCGERPFQGGPLEVISQHVLTPPPPLREQVPSLPAAIEQVVLTALAKDPSERFGSVRAFATAFQQACGEAGTASVLSTQPIRPFAPANTPSLLQGQGSRLVSEASARPARLGAGQADQAGASIFSATTHITPQRPLTGQGSQAAPSLSSAETQLTPGQDWAASVAPTGPSAPLVTTETAYGGGAPATRRNEAAPATRPGSPVPGQPHGLSRRRVVVAGGAGLLLLGSGAAALLLAQKPGSPVPTSTGTRPTSTPTAAIPTPTPTATVPPPQPGTTLFTFQGHTDAVNSVAWSPDGIRIASASDDLTVQVWDATTGSHVLLYREHRNKVNTVAWSPNGVYLASAGLDATVRVWEAATGKTVAVYTSHQSTVWSVAWSPDSRRLASASSDTTAQVWEALSQQGVFTYRQHTNHVWSVAWSPDGRSVASASKDETVRIWDPTTGADLYVYTKHTYGVAKVAWSPGGNRIASGSFDGTVQIWDPSTGGNRLVQHQAGVPLNWSTYGQRIASADQDKLVQVWSASSGTMLLTYHQHTAPVADIAWSPGGERIASASADHTVQVWAVAADAS